MFTRTKEGEFAFFSPGRNVGWRLVKDNEDPGKKEWELVDPNTGRVLETHTGVLTLGGRLGNWIQGGWENMSQLHKENITARQEYAAEMIAKGYFLNKRGRWQRRLDFKSDTEQSESIAADLEETNTGEGSGDTTNTNVELELPSFTSEITDQELEEAKTNNPEAFVDTPNANDIKINGGDTTVETPNSNNIRISKQEQLNRERFGDEHIDHLKQKNIDFQNMKKGLMSREQFIALYPNSQLAIKQRRLNTKLGIR